MNYPLHPYRFDTQTQSWQIVAPEATDTSLANLTCVTFNVWFEPHYFAERCAALLQLVKAYNPDIIALQEVTPPFLEYLLAQAWVRQQYAISDALGITVDGYGVAMLSRITPLQFTLYELTSFMNRHLLVTELSLNTKRTAIGTVHLESKSPFAKMRGQQLREVFGVLQPEPHVLLMGDFNFCSSWKEENERIPDTYRDMWSVLHPDLPGYTVDTPTNTMRLEHTGKHKSVRFDHIIVRSIRPGWSPVAIELLGTNPIAAELPNVFPSDHFGLVGRLKWYG
ncbi:MAG: endonuclease/exonuclease/phosphatase family protein [Chloroflexota bacterium]